MKKAFHKALSFLMALVVLFFYSVIYNQYALLW